MSPGRRRIRVPMFAKFLIGCLALAALLIIGGTYVVQNETQFRSRGNYLQKAIRRLAGYVDRVGQGMTGTLEILAVDPELRAAFLVPVTEATGGEEARARTVDAVGRRMFEQLSAKNGLAPDLFAIFTTGNDLLYTVPKSPLVEPELPQLGAVAQARTGSVFAHRIQMLAGVPYQVSALPIRASKASDQIVGGILIGVRLERYFQEWAEQTDEDAAMRTRPTLADGLTVLATAWPAETQRVDLARALQPDRYVRMVVGQDVRDATKIGDELQDVYGEPYEGYKGLENGVIGKLSMTRSRMQLANQAEHLPWTEIVAGIVASVAIAFLLAFWVTRPIKQMLRQSRDLLAGETDLTQRIAVTSTDESADLADNINQVFERVHHLATGVQSAAFQVGASSAEISAASRQMLAGLKDQTLKIESSTTAVTELSASIQQVAGNAQQATSVAEQSSTAVTSAVARMEQIRAAVDDAAGKMRDLGESSKRIGNIVEVIRQISEQTSMLALNASIEAAHAGEQGRGFAVVADEVSSLARRVGQSAKDIEALIQTVKEQTQAAIASMEVGTREVLGGSQLVTSTLTGLGELITVVKDTATAVHEQAVVSDEIARNMDAVRNLAGEALHGSEESVVQSERLHELAYELEESIAGFNLDG
ncbi:MAG TPA: HAMP domain-containing methyl-accepting chemotaxis protein, partial [Kofleriaceae bacterium]|nr:HAMP domain-containing methyl-accepting chemotaxis protein [Kofleriaceae bacterium]